jgi:hypothetical protein
VPYGRLCKFYALHQVEQAVLAGDTATTRRAAFRFAVAARGRLLATPGIVFLFDLLDAAQPFFPDALKRARNQAVLGFDRIILPSRPLGVVAGTFALERPLPLDLGGLPVPFHPTRRSPRRCGPASMPPEATVQPRHRR